MRALRKPRTFVWLLFLIGIILLIALPSRAAVWQVPGDFPTIQSAVDAVAPGDEILVATGSFEEQIVITKSLILTGSGTSQTILQAPVNMPHTAHTLQYNAVIHVELPAVSVTIRDLTVDGLGRGAAGYRFTGIMFDQTHGSVERVEIQNFNETPVSTAISGIGLYAYSTSADVGDLLLEDVTVHDVQKAGVVCAGAGTDHEMLRVVVDRGAILTDAVLNGIEMALGAKGTLTDCTVEDVYYDGTPNPIYTSVGILFYYAGSVVMQDCRSLENQTGFFDITTSAEVRGLELTSYPSLLVYNNGVVVTTGGGSAQTGGNAVGEPVPTESADAAGTRGYVDLVLEDCSVTGAGLSNSTGLTFQSNFLDLDVSLARCRVSSWDYGVRSLEESGGEVIGTATAGRIAGNLTVGVEANTVMPFDARGNDWGDPTGPFHAGTNPGGLGDMVTDHVLFDPWLTGNVVCSPLPQYIAQDDWTGSEHADTVALHYLGGGSDLLYGYSIDLLWDDSKLTAANVDVSRPDQGAFHDAALFMVYPVPGGLRVDAGLGGVQPGIAAGPLCQVRFALVGTPDYTEVPITVVINDVRNHHNELLTGFAADPGLVVGDVQAPVFTLLKLINDTLPHTDLFLKNGDQVRVSADVTDGDPAFGIPHVRGDLVLLLGPVGWLLWPDDYTAPTASWTARPAFATPADGTVVFGVTATDPAGNVASTGGTVTSDNTPPLPLQGLTASPGHQKVALAWDDPSGLDLHLHEIEFRAEPWGDYPQYATPGPAYPAGPGDGIHAVTVTGGTQIEWTGVTDRDIYYLTGLVTDVVLQTAVPDPAGSQGHATSYWLGDVEPLPGGDGDVDVTDVSVLGASYGLLEGEVGFNAHCDVGPTFDGSSRSIPLPDDAIDFPDMMIFALNFGVVGPLLEQPASGAIPRLALRRLDDVTWALVLETECPGLKGLNLAATLPEGVSCQVAPGELLARQQHPVFLQNIPARGLDAGFAVLGRGIAIAGAGELCRITTTQPVVLQQPVIQARDVNNEELLAEVTAAPGVEIPAAFALLPNHPNPFNPRTSLTFDLPRSVHVRLGVYGIDGGLIRLVVDERRPAGRHSEIWDGRDAAGRPCATGTYFAVIEAGEHRAAHKMVLMR